MDENEPQGGLAQAVAPPPVASQPLAAAPSAKPEPSEYEKALASYQQQKQQLIEQQRKLVDSLESRIGGPAESLFALSAGFGKHAPSFGESFGNAMGAYGAQQAKSRQEMSDIAKMRLELGAQQVGMRKENVELAKTKQLSGALTNLLSGRASPEASAAFGFTREQASLVAGMPSEYKAIIIAQMETGDVKGAVQELQKYMFESTKEPEKIKELRYYMSQLQSPAARSAAQQLAANNYFLGNPADRAKAILDIRKAIDDNIIPASDGNILIQGMTSIGGGQPSAPAAPAVAPQASPAPAGFPVISPKAQAERDKFAEKIRAKEENGAGIPTSKIVGTTSDISPRQARELEVKRQEELIARHGKEEEDTSKNVFSKYEESEKNAVGAFSRVNSMAIYKKLGANAAAGRVQPVITGVKNILSSFGFTPESLVNEQVMSSTIDYILANYMKELGARGLTDTDIKTIKNSLPTLNTSKESRIAVANIIQKVNTKVIDQYRVDRVNLTKNYPNRLNRAPFPNFYKEWIAQTNDVKDFLSGYSNANTQEEKEEHKKAFDSYYGFGSANQFVGK